MQVFFTENRPKFAALVHKTSTTGATTFGDLYTNLHHSRFNAHLRLSSINNQRQSLSHLHAHMLGDFGPELPETDGNHLSPYCAAWRWRSGGDLLVIDNATMLHRATTAAMAAGAERRMLRVSVRGEAPVAARDPRGRGPTE